MTASSLGNRSTLLSLIALIGGLGLGILIHGSGNAFLTGLAGFIEPLGRVWVRALQMVVVPLIISQLLLVMLRRQGATVGRLGPAAIGLFVVLLLLGAAVTLVTVPPVLDRLPVDHALVTSLNPMIPESARAAAERDVIPVGFADWLVGLIPTNPARSLVDGDLLQIMLFTLFFGWAASRTPPRSRRRAGALSRTFAEIMLVMVHALLRFTPLGVFGLSLAFGRSGGSGVASVLVQLVVLVSASLLLLTLLLYPLAVLVGRVSLKDFARAVYPAQLVAVSTRSSLASLPALVEGARDRLALSAAARGFVLPLAAATFKINRTTSSTIKLLFMAHLYGIALEPTQIITFVLTVVILSFSSLGLPGGGTAFKTLPAYLAAGMPIEAVVLLEAVDVIPDIFKTLANTTGYMTTAVVLDRGEREPIEGTEPAVGVEPA